MALDAATQTRLQELREKSKMNTITIEEMKEAVTLMREGRVAASATSAKAKATKSAAKKSVDSEDLLSQLDALGGL